LRNPPPMLTMGLFLGPIGVRIAGGLIPPEKKD
jgi:hypothetical protein